ncbi:DUF5133 domain-containing protein [Streptomyces sp. NPDC005708]|uniref:DUF5133 domain-containing protein n=1 Tax=Streptomyces sp. NPDC005708 TaxID=3154564 RepID=UPI0033E90B95
MPLVPDPKVVRQLLTRYASLQIALAESEKPEGARELEDVSYTLCVMTGTRRVHDAVEVADALLVAGTERDSVRVPDGKHGLRWQSPLSEEAATQRAAFPGQGAAEF